MTTENQTWQQVTSGHPGRRLAGYFPGAIAGGTLVVEYVAGEDLLMQYRAFRVEGGAGLQEFLVSGLEVVPDYTAVRGASPSATGAGVRAAVEGALDQGQVISATLPTSDGAEFFAVGHPDQGPLEALAAWPDEGGEVVVVPVRLSVPPSCLVPLTVPTKTAPTPPLASTARETPIAPVSTGGRGRILAAAALVVALVSGTLVWRSGKLRSETAGQTDTSQTSGSQPLVPAPTLPADTVPPETTGGSTTDPQQPEPGVDKGGTRPPVVLPNKSKDTPPVIAKSDSPGTSVPVVTRDDDRSIRELARLQDAANDTQAYTPEQAASLAREAARLYARLIEPMNKSEAARVVLQAWTRAGGDPEACRYLSAVTDLTNAERGLFRSTNRCSGS